MKLSQREKDYNKCLRKIDSLITSAIDERNKKGYRENLGYDSINKLKDYISNFDTLMYIDGCKLESIFNQKCKEI